MLSRLTPEGRTALTAEGVLDRCVYGVALEPNMLDAECCLFQLQLPYFSSSLSKKVKKVMEERSLGAVVTYGQPLQLRHMHSESVLSIDRMKPGKCAGTSMVMLVSDFGSGLSVLTLRPSEQSTKIGEPVRYSEKVLVQLEDEGFGLFLNSSSVAGKLEIDAGHRSATWEFSKYSDWTDSKDSVRANFPVIFRNMSVSADLTERRVQINKYMDVCEEAVAKEIETAIRVRQAASGGTYPQEREEGQTLQPEELTTVEHIYLTSNPKDYYKFWLLEKINASVGGELRFNEQFNLKNVKSGLYLSHHGVLVDRPPTDMKFCIPKPENFPEGSPIPLGYSLILSAWDATGARASLAAENRSRSEECMPIVVPAKHSNSAEAQEMTIEIPATLLGSEKGGRTELFQIYPLEGDIAFTLKIARLGPKAKELAMELKDWVSAQSETSRALLEEHAEQLRLRMAALVDTLSEIGRVMRASRSAEAYEDKQTAIAGLDLHSRLIDIAEAIFENSQVTATPATRLFYEATRTAFTQIWETLIQVASENFYSCSQLETHKERICAMVVREKRLIGKLLTEIYRMVDPVMPDYSEEFYGWYRRLETLNASNIEEQTVFINLIHCLCEVGDHVKVEYQRVIVGLLFDSPAPFPIFRLDRSGRDFIVEFFPKCGDSVEKLVSGNPFLQADPQQLAAGHFCVSLDSIKRGDAYIDYLYTAMSLMNTLSKGSWTEGRSRIQEVVQLSAGLVLSMVKRESLPLKIRQACLELCETLIVSMEAPAFQPARSNDDNCVIASELSADESEDFTESQMNAQSGSLRECVHLTVGVLSKNELPVTITSYPFRTKLDYVRAALALSESMLEQGHYSHKEVRKLAQVAANFLCALSGDSSSTKHWAVSFLKSSVSSLGAHKGMELELKLQVNELFRVVISLLYRIRTILSRQKVLKLLRISVGEECDPAAIVAALNDDEKEALNSSFRRAASLLEGASSPLISTSDPKARTSGRRRIETNENMFKLTLTWGSIHPSLKETVISLLKMLFDERTFIYNLVKQAEVLYAPGLVQVYRLFKAKVEESDLGTLLPEIRTSLLSNPHEAENEQLGALYAWVSETTDSLCVRRGGKAAQMQNIVRSVGLHTAFMGILQFCTQLPVEFDLVHVQLFRLKAALSAFFFYFIKDNRVNRELLSVQLQKHHYFVLIPRYCDFLRELCQFDHMSSADQSKFYQYILRTFVREGGLWTNGLHFLRVMMFDRCGRPLKDRQIAIARYIMEITAEKYILHVTPVTARLVELLALAACDNDPISQQCSALLPLSLLHQLSQTADSALQHALLQFLHYVYIRPTHLDRPVTHEISGFLDIVTRSIQLLSPVFSGDIDFAALGRSGAYEQIFPAKRPSLVEEGTALFPFEPSACLLRLLSSGNEWESKGGVLHVVPGLVRYFSTYKEAVQLGRDLGEHLVQLQHRLKALENTHQDLDFSLLSRSVRDCLKSLSDQSPVRETHSGFDQEETAESRFQQQLSRFLALFTSATASSDPRFYLSEMVSIFLVVSLGKDSVLSAKLSKDNLESMEKVLIRVKKLFFGTSHRRLYFDFLREIVPAGDSQSDLQIKYRLNNVFIVSEVIVEALNALIRHETLDEVDAIYGFLNRLLERQTKEFMDEFLRMLDVSEKSYSLFLQIKEEMVEVRNHMLAVVMPKGRLGTGNEDEEVLKARIETLGKALIFLQCCCDNCHLDFQNYIHRQRKREGQADLDILSEVAQFVIDMRTLGDSLLKCMPAARLLVQALGALCDFVTGPCPGNQAALGENLQLFLSLNDLLLLVQSHINNPTLNQLHQNLLLFLAAMLEGSPSDSIYENMVTFMNWEEMRRGLEDFYESKVRPKREVFMLEREDGHSGCLKEKLDIFLLQAILLLKLKSKYENLPEFRAFHFVDLDPYSAYSFFSSYTGYVEIEKPTGGLQAHFFPIPFKCKYLTPASRRALIYGIDRSSHQKKIEEFLRLAPSANREMEHQQLLSVSKTLKAISSRWKLYAQLSFIVVLVINLQLLFSLEGSIDETTRSQEAAMVGVKISGVVQIVLYIACVFFLILEYFPAYFHTDDSFSSLEFDRYAIVPNNESHHTKVLYRGMKHGRIKPSTVQLSLREIGNSLGLYYHYIYFLISIMAIHDPMMYPLLLLDLIKQNEELVNVLKSITLNMRQLFLTLVLGLIVVFLFSCYSFMFLQADFDPEDSLYCDSLWNCFSTTLYYGTRSGGGIGDALSTPSPDRSVERMIFDMLFFLVIIIIFLNIIFGIIIDTFAELRDSRTAYMDDVMNVCFVCGTERNVIDLRGRGWSYHFMCEHSTFAYLSFLIYVRGKPTQDCTGIEKYVQEKLLKNDTSFMPTTFASLKDSDLSN